MRMAGLLSPLCFFLALAMLVLAFALWAVGPPEPPAAMHQAGATGDDAFREALESQLAERQRTRTVLIVCLVGGSVVMIGLAFFTGRPPAEQRGPD